jgi:hypothetical protein
MALVRLNERTMRQRSTATELTRSWKDSADDFVRAVVVFIGLIQGDALGDSTVMRQMEKAAGNSCRTTVTIPKDYAQLLRLAEASHVSLGWMIRDAIRVYLNQQIPLFSATNRRGVSS